MAGSLRGAVESSRARCLFPGSLRLLGDASRAPINRVPGWDPPAEAAALLSAGLRGVWDLDATGARCVFTGSQRSSSAGRQAPRAPIMAPVLRQESARSFRWHVKGSWRRKLAFRLGGPGWRIPIKVEKMAQQERSRNISDDNRALTRVSDNHREKLLKCWSLRVCGASAGSDQDHGSPGIPQWGHFNAKLEDLGL